MNTKLPIWIIEPAQTEKRDLAALKLVKGGQKAADVTSTITIEGLEQQLKTIRRYARDNIYSLADELKMTIDSVFPDIKVKSAVDNVDAVRYLTEISDGTDTISINNSSIVTQELMPGLTNSGFTVINSYLDEFDMKENEVHDYWDLPRLLEKDLTGTFDVTQKMTGLPDFDTRNYMTVLGVNAISAEDGTVFFLEHFSNIIKDLREAGKVILVVGLDKIVKTRHEAAFQTQCMGIFGMESIILSIGSKMRDRPAIDKLSLLQANKERELHLIILDNGRTGLLDGKFSDLFLCIGCRACNKHCPVHHSLTNVDYIWTPRNYLNQFLHGISRSIDTCLHCEACRMECPLDIDLPSLMWEAKIDYISKHGRSFRHKILGIPEILAKFGTCFAFLSNWLMRIKLVRIPMEIITGIDRRAKLPEFHFTTFRKWFKENAR